MAYIVVDWLPLHYKPWWCSGMTYIFCAHTTGVRICPCTLEHQTLMNLFLTLLEVCFQTLWRSIIYYLLLAWISQCQECVCVYHRPGGQAYPNLDHPLYIQSWLKLIMSTKHCRIGLRFFSHMWFEIYDCLLAYPYDHAEAGKGRWWLNECGVWLLGTTNLGKI